MPTDADPRPDATPEQPHEHGRDYSHEHDHEHGHDDPSGLLARIKGLVAPHSHDAADSVDTELETSRRGTRAVLVSLVILGVTTVVQAIVVVFSGSVALLGDTLHNASDALTAVPLAIAFSVGRRPANRRYTYGYGRAEDLAGISIVLLILASAAFAGYEAIHRLVDPRPVDHVAIVALAGFVGFLGNEFVAQYRIRVGRDIGSAALVADGLHARTDGFTSLAVVAGALGVGLGFEQADPIVGLLITFAILFVLRDAARQVYRRLMDAVDEDLVDDVERVLLGTPGVLGVGQTRLRWIGHALRAECEVVVAADLSLTQAHGIAVEAEHRLLHDVRRLTAAFIHADPQGVTHEELTGHRYDRSR